MRPQQRYGNGIVENAGLVENLVNGATEGHAKGSFAGAASFHGLSVHGAESAAEGSARRVC
jgi:hypothetical protein